MQGQPGQMGGPGAPQYQPPYGQPGPQGPGPQGPGPQYGKGAQVEEITLESDGTVYQQSIMDDWDEHMSDFEPSDLLTI